MLILLYKIVTNAYNKEEMIWRGERRNNNNKGLAKNCQLLHICLGLPLDTYQLV